jgi:hypothetical protein
MEYFCVVLCLLREINLWLTDLHRRCFFLNFYLNQYVKNDLIFWILCILLKQPKHDNKRNIIHYKGCHFRSP